MVQLAPPGHRVQHVARQVPQRELGEGTPDVGLDHRHQVRRPDEDLLAAIPVVVGPLTADLLHQAEGAGDGALRLDDGAPGRLADARVVDPRPAPLGMPQRIGRGGPGQGLDRQLQHPLEVGVAARLADVETEPLEVPGDSQHGLVEAIGLFVAGQERRPAGWGDRPQRPEALHGLGLQGALRQVRWKPGREVDAPPLLEPLHRLAGEHRLEPVLVGGQLAHELHEPGAQSPAPAGLGQVHQVADPGHETALGSRSPTEVGDQLRHRLVGAPGSQGSIEREQGQGAALPLGEQGAHQVLGQAAGGGEGLVGQEGVVEAGPAQRARELGVPGSPGEPGPPGHHADPTLELPRSELDLRQGVPVGQRAEEGLCPAPAQQLELAAVGEGADALERRRRTAGQAAPGAPGHVEHDPRTGR